MPSTVGHVIAGAMIAWASDTREGIAIRHLVPDPGPDNCPARLNGEAAGALNRPVRLTLVCAALAAAPDLDVLFRSHRTYTHSVGATILVTFVAAATAAYARLPVARVALACAAAHASHIVLDWLAADRTLPYGIQALWPFTHQFYISGLDLFRQTERRHLFTGEAIRANALAVAQEMVILGPPALGVWLVRVKALTRFSTVVAGGDHAPQ
jgi:hypothetical protein